MGAIIAVVFASLGSGPDARFANGDTQITVLTDANGQASVPVSANSVAGSYRVEASIAGVYTPVVFTLSNVAGVTVALPLIVSP